MAKRNPRPTDKPNWIPDDTSGIITPPGAKQTTGWLKEEKPPFQYFNWFWNIVTQLTDYMLPRADKYNIIIDTDSDEGDYDTLADYLADAPVAGDRVFIKVDEVILVQTVIPAGITLHQLAGKKFSCAVNIATSIFQFEDDVVIEGPFKLETTQSGTTAIAFEVNGSNCYIEEIELENSGTGTITDAVKVNATEEVNYIKGSTNNSGAGAITNPLNDSSSRINNDIIIRDLGGSLNTSNQLVTPSIRDIVRNLTVQVNAANPLFQVDIDADEILLQNSSGNPFRVTNVNLTADITVSGINGLDTGVEGSSQWYYIWVIYDGTTVSSLLSLSDTAPTLPAGYTFKALVGAVRNDGSSDFEAFYQVDNKVNIESKASIASNPGTTWTSVNLVTYVPVTAKAARVVGRVVNTAGAANYSIAAHNVGGIAYGESRFEAETGGRSQAPAVVPLFVAQTIWHHESTGVAGLLSDMDLEGWEY
jgi:hypothetical protein